MFIHCPIYSRGLGALFSKTEAALRAKKKGIVKNLLAGAALGAAAGYGVHKLKEHHDKKEAERAARGDARSGRYDRDNYYTD